MTGQEVMDAIRLHGPTRVVIDGSGEATNSRRAREELGVLPDVLFMRRDGWSLAAPACFEQVAHAMWADEWEWFWRRGESTPRPIEEYRGR